MLNIAAHVSKVSDTNTSNIRTETGFGSYFGAVPYIKIERIQLIDNDSIVDTRN